MALRCIIMLALIALVSCKTAEQIQQEKKVNEVVAQTTQGQKIMADYTARLQLLEERISKVAGTQEEAQYRSKQQLDQTQKTLLERMKLLEENLKTVLDNQETIKADFEEQKTYIEQVTVSLNKISTLPSVAQSDSPYTDANKFFDKKKFVEATPLYKEVIKSKKATPKEKAHSHHQLGLIFLQEKDYGEALTHFSIVITKFSKSPFVPSSLFNIAKCFEGKKEIAPAKASLLELISKYPKSVYSKKAKPLLEELERK